MKLLTRCHKLIPPLLAAVFLFTAALAHGGNEVKGLRAVKISDDGSEVTFSLQYSYDGAAGSAARILPVIAASSQQKVSSFFGADPVSISPGQGTISVKVKFFNDDPGSPKELTTDIVRIMMLNDSGSSVLTQGNFSKTIKWGVPPTEQPSESPDEAKARQDAEAQAANAAQQKAEQEKQAVAAKAQAEAQARAQQEKAATEAKALEEARQKAEQERIAAEAKAKAAAEAIATAQLKAEQERLAAEAKAKVEAEAKAAEEARQKAERERLAAEAKAKAQAEAQAAELARQKAEQERLALEAKVKAEAEARVREQARLKAEQERIAAEAKTRAEAEVKAREQARQRADQERLAAEARAKAEAEAKAAEVARQKAEAKAAEEARKKAEQERLAAEAKAKAEAEARAVEAAHVKAEQERLAAEAKAKAEAEAKAAEEARQRAEQARLAAEAKAKAAAEAIAAAQRKAEQDRLAAEAKSRAEAETKAREDALAKARIAPPKPATAKSIFIGGPKIRTTVTNIDIVRRSMDRTEMTIGVDYDYAESDGPAKMGVEYISSDDSTVAGYFSSPMIDIGNNPHDTVLIPAKLGAAAAKAFNRPTLPTDKIWIYMVNGAGVKSYIFQGTMVLLWHVPGGGRAAVSAAAAPRNTAGIDSFKQNDPFSGYAIVKYTMLADSGTLHLRVYSSANPGSADWFKCTDIPVRAGPGMQLVKIAVPLGAKCPDVFKADTLEIQILDNDGKILASAKKADTLTWAKPK